MLCFMCTNQHNPDTAASSDCATGIKEITAPVALVASPAVDHIQVISSDVQGSQHVHSDLPAPL